MIKFKPRNSYLIVIVLLLLVIAGMWFYQALYGATGEALRRAENFLFTRMTVSQLGEQGSSRYFSSREERMKSERSRYHPRKSANRGHCWRARLYHYR